MNRFRKHFRNALVTFTGVAVFFPAQVLAQGNISLVNPSRFDSLEEIIGVVLGLFRPVVVITLVAVLMYGGWVYLNAGDQDDQVAKARKIITAAVVGFIIIVLAPAIAQFVGALLGVDGGLFNFTGDVT